MQETVQPKRQIKRLVHLGYSPQINPLLERSEPVPIKKKRVRSGLAEKVLADAATGEVIASSVIHQIEECDTDQFVKVFAAGIAAAYDLSKTGQRVFQAVLREYEKTPMKGGFAEAVSLWWFGDGLAGEDIGMSESTFNRGLWELLEKGFLAPKQPNIFWVNPALFFKGDRVMFVKEYRLKSQKQSELSSESKSKVESPKMQPAQALRIADLPPEIQAEVMGLVDQLNASKAMRGGPGEWKAGD